MGESLHVIRFGTVGFTPVSDSERRGKEKPEGSGNPLGKVSDETQGETFPNLVGYKGSVFASEIEIFFMKGLFFKK